MLIVSKHMQLKMMNYSKLFLSFFLFSVFLSFASSFSSFSNTTTHKCSPKQSHALLLFKQNLFSINDTSYDSICQDRLGSGYHPIMMNWNKSVDCCSWNGVTCSQYTSDVIALDLSCGMLRGTIHPNTTLFNLPHLQKLNLAFNFLTDQLPREIGNLSNSLTHLNISNCWFSGQIPLEISLLPKLVSLDLSRNGFDLEPRIFNNLIQNSTLLRELLLGDVSISSFLPTYLNVSSSLTTLDLGYTGLQGKLPDNIFNIQSLEKLDLWGNDGIVGPLPKVNTSIINRLNWLGLADTGLSGQIPYSIGHLTSLSYLDLSSSNISSGEIPYSIGHLNSLNTLRLRGCGLMGPFPKFLVNLRHLSYLDLSYNMFNGTVPSFLFTLPSLEIIDLSYNMFSGSLPSELFTQRSLKRLHLEHNQFDGMIDVLDQGSIRQTFQQLLDLTELDLSNNKFTGVWELDTLFSSLTTLEYLSLSYSGLSVKIGNASHYVNPNFQTLALASCKIKVFPESLLRATRELEFLDLSRNEIDGHIGGIEGNQLFYLDLSHNIITGPFPPSIWNMGNLQYLNLSNNRFSGVIKPGDMNFSVSAISVIDIGNNNFSGTIPHLCGGELRGLILNGNQFEGEVPSCFSESRELEVLDLGNNRLNGKFPDQLGRLPNLKVLVLKSNKFHGSIESFSMIQHPFPSLKVLILSQNEFVGHLPRKYFQNFDAMKNVVKKGTKPEYLSLGGGKFYSIVAVVKGVELSFPKIFVDYTIVDLSSNIFEGEIPDVIGSLNSLKVLNLSHNHLNGRIPNDLGNLSEIESLDLSWNRLTGQIPQSLADITALAVLNLSQNHLVGRIPSGTQFSTFSTSFGGNLGLCGLPLPKHCEHVSTPQLEVDEDEESEFTWKVVMLGYGCGTILGLVLGYLMLSTGRPKWFNAVVDKGGLMIEMRRNKRRYAYVGKRN